MRLSIFTGVCSGILLFLLFIGTNNLKITEGIIKFTLLGFLSIIGLIEFGIYVSNLFSNKKIDWEVKWSKR